MEEKSKMSNGLWQSVKDNVIFVLVCLIVAAGVFLTAYAAEKYVRRRDGIAERILNTRKVAMIGLFSAIALLLFLFEFPIPFLAPSFYELDFSEIPALIGAFAFGPVAGVMIEFCKVVLKLVIKGTSTGFVGDLANFVIGCSLILPASIIYMFKKTRKRDHDGIRVGFQRDLSASGVRGVIRYADGRDPVHGRGDQRKYQQRYYLRMFCGCADEHHQERVGFPDNAPDL